MLAITLAYPCQPGPHGLPRTPLLRPATAPARPAKPRYPDSQWQIKNGRAHLGRGGAASLLTTGQAGGATGADRLSASTGPAWLDLAKARSREGLCIDGLGNRVRVGGRGKWRGVQGEQHTHSQTCVAQGWLKRTS